MVEWKGGSSVLGMNVSINGNGEDLLKSRHRLATLLNLLLILHDNLRRLGGFCLVPDAFTQLLVPTRYQHSEQRLSRIPISAGPLSLTPTGHEN